MTTPITLTNGLRLVLIPTDTEIVAVRAFWPGGSGQETAATQGLAHLLSTVLTKGCGTLGSQAIASKIEMVGASLSADNQSDYFLGGISCLVRDLPALLHLFAEILREPTFPEQELELERRNTLQAIKSQQERPFTVAYNHLRQQLYGTTHPYSFPDYGTNETIQQLSQNDLATYHQRVCQPNHMVLCIACSLTEAQLLSLVEACFGAWVVNEPALLAPIADVQLPPTRHTITQTTQQATLLLGYPTVGLNDHDHIALKLLSTYLGSGLSSRLFIELREKKGLAYEVSAFYPAKLGKSHFVTYIGTAPENLEVAEAGLRQEAQRLTEIALTADELVIAKNKMLGQYALGKQSSAQLARVLGVYEFLGWGTAYDQQYPELIEALTAETIQTVAARYFSTEPSMTLVGPA